MLNNLQIVTNVKVSKVFDLTLHLLQFVFNFEENVSYIIEQVFGLLCQTKTLHGSVKKLLEFYVRVWIVLKLYSLANQIKLSKSHFTSALYSWYYNLAHPIAIFLM